MRVCDYPGLRGEIGVGAEDAEVVEGRRLGGEEGDLDAVPLARGGGSGGLVRAVGDVAPNAEKDTVGVGGADVGQGRWVEGLLLGQGDHGGCCGGEPQGGWGGCDGGGLEGGCVARRRIRYYSFPGLNWGYLKFCYFYRWHLSVCHL